MTTLIEKSFLNERLEKSRSGTYSDTSENRRKHRVGQKYGEEKKEEPKSEEKKDSGKITPEQTLEAVNKVIAAVNSGKLKLSPEEINTLVAKKTMAEEASKAAKAEKKSEPKKEPEKKPESSGEKQDELKTAQEELQRIKDKKDSWVAKYGKNSYDTRLQQAKDEVERLKNKERSEKEKKSDEKSSKKAEEMKERVKGSEKGEKSKEESKPEPKKEEAEESYTRVKFEDVPNSGKVNLKKYLSEKMKRSADEAWGDISKIDTKGLQKMEKGLVEDFNRQFDDLPKSRRAEKLYAIIKVKGELAKRGKESQKKE